ncbi:MAG TPA: type II toxin-antitoxin system HicB family antitoxin [Ktedonobacterales bacterium]|nr:type II toxin-antitoxin system HicB family antitoxin [Ktedonobacterales bacterium]
MSEEQHYSMVIEWSDEDQAYLVILPEWTDRIIGGPAVTHGKTYEEAVRRGHEAIEALIVSARKHGEPLPTPRVYASV